MKQFVRRITDTPRFQLWMLYFSIRNRTLGLVHGISNARSN